jgi:hypothetical protein
MDRNGKLLQPWVAGFSPPDAWKETYNYYNKPILGIRILTFTAATKKITQDRDNFRRDGLIVGDKIETGSVTNPGPFTIKTLTPREIVCEDTDTVEDETSVYTLIRKVDGTEYIYEDWKPSPPMARSFNWVPTDDAPDQRTIGWDASIIDCLYSNSEDHFYMIARLKYRDYPSAAESWEIKRYFILKVNWYFQILDYIEIPASEVFPHGSMTSDDRYSSLISQDGKLLTIFNIDFTLGIGNTRIRYADLLDYSTEKFFKDNDEMTAIDGFKPMWEQPLTMKVIDIPLYVKIRVKLDTWYPVHFRVTISPAVTYEDHLKVKVPLVEDATSFIRLFQSKYWHLRDASNQAPYHMRVRVVLDTIPADNYMIRVKVPLASWGSDQRVMNGDYVTFNYPYNWYSSIETRRAFPVLQPITEPELLPYYYINEGGSWRYGMMTGWITDICGAWSISMKCADYLSQGFDSVAVGTKVTFEIHRILKDDNQVACFNVDVTLSSKAGCVGAANTNPWNESLYTQRYYIRIYDHAGNMVKEIEVARIDNPQIGGGINFIPNQMIYRNGKFGLVFVNTSNWADELSWSIWDYGGFNRGEIGTVMFTENGRFIRAVKFNTTFLSLDSGTEFNLVPTYVSHLTPSYNYDENLYHRVRNRYLMADKDYFFLVVESQLADHIDYQIYFLDDNLRIRKTIKPQPQEFFEKEQARFIADDFTSLEFATTWKLLGPLEGSPETLVLKSKYADFYAFIDYDGNHTGIKRERFIKSAFSTFYHFYQWWYKTYIHIPVFVKFSANVLESVTQPEPEPAPMDIEEVGEYQVYDLS